jgi:Adaptor complexes medium subunit family
VQFSVSGRANSGLVLGKVICRAVTPTPSKCVLHFNDPYASATVPSPCYLDEMVFHDCVDRNALLKHRGRLVFAPPGALNFHLMRYRKFQPNLDDLPLQLRPSYVYDRGEGLLQVSVELHSCYKAEYTASNLHVVIPVPTHCLPKRSDITYSKGKLKVCKAESAVLWKVNKLRGSSPVATSFQVPVSASSYDAWERSPVTLEVGHFRGPV